MKIDIKKSASSTQIIIEGNIKSLSDNNELKKSVENSWVDHSSKPIEIHIKDSFIITSSAIGFLIKFIKKDNMKILIYISDSDLYEMLDDMNLIEVLNIKKV